MALQNLIACYADCLVNRMAEKGCSLDLGGLGVETVVLKCDKLPDAQRYAGRLCDYVVVREHNSLALAALELKSGWLDARHAAEQLQGGADWLEVATAGEKVRRFTPVLVHGKGISPNEFRALRRLHVLHRDRRHPISACKSGELLKRFVE